ncbi:MAG TPA: EamA family transporter [Actinomycetota bacterium]|nr:EamA family transporter [Actinomycetota bacterium]
MRDLRLVTAAGPCLWGTNYLVTTQLLPPDRPFLAAAARALPAGLLLWLAVGFTLPRGRWWWRAAVLGALNIGLFFVLFFIGAYRLPGGIAAVLGAMGPFLVAGLSYPLLGHRVSRRVLVAATIGVLGVGLLVLRSTAALDPLGLLASGAGVVVVSVATVLGRRWGTPSVSRPVLTLTAWQLTFGGLLLAPLALLVEGPPPALTGANVLGFAYLALVGTAVAHFLWFQGVQRLAPTSITLLSLLSPVVAAVIGWAVLGQALSPGQLVGAVAVLGAVLLGTSVRTAGASARTVRTPIRTVPPAGTRPAALPASRAA